MPNTKNVLISGASTGIGKACALYLAKQGFAVVAGVRKLEDGRRIEAEAGGNIRSIQLDIADSDSIAKARDQVGKLYGLVNNAGIGIGGPVEHVTVDDWRKQFEVNVVGHIALTQAMLPALREMRGRIVFIGSIAGRVAMPMLGPYSASKHAIAAVALSLRMEVQGQGIRVSLLEPGAIQSDIWKKADEFTDTIGPSHRAREHYSRHIDAMAQQTKEAARNAIPAEEVARMVGKCLSDPNPPFRVLIGRDARTAAFLKWFLPERVFYRVLARSLKLP